MSTHAIDDYVHRVMDQVPFALPERERIEGDLRAHLAETAEAEGEQTAVRRMGTPESVARGYLEEIPLEYASVGSRFLAFAIDLGLGLAILGAIGAAVAAVLALIAPGERVVTVAWVALPMIAVAVSVFLLSVAYFPVMEWRFGQTLGKRMMGIHVVREDGRRIGVGQAVVRRIPCFLEFFWIDGFVALFTERKQRAFDLVARTVVTTVRPSIARAPNAVSQHV